MTKMKDPFSIDLFSNSHPDHALESTLDFSKLTVMQVTPLYPNNAGLQVTMTYRLS